MAGDRAADGIVIGAGVGEIAFDVGLDDNMLKGYGLGVGLDASEVLVKIGTDTAKGGMITGTSNMTRVREIERCVAAPIFGDGGGIVSENMVEPAGVIPPGEDGISDIGMAELG